MPVSLAMLLASVALAIAATPLAAAACRRFGFVDEPGVRKVHSRATPILGGVTIVASTLGALGVVLLLYPNAAATAAAAVAPKAPLLAAALLMLGVGVYDDLTGMRARHKLFAQVVVASILCVDGIRIDAIELSAEWTIELGWLAAPATVLWVVVLANAVNLIDGMDGLAAGIAALAASIVALLAARAGDPLLSITMVGLTGSLLGFLVFNFHPAKIFLGDSGTLFLGFSIAGASLATGGGKPTFDALALTLVALSIPVLDTGFAMLRRFLERRSIFAPDRNHLHHRLLRKGLDQRRAALVLYVYAAVPTALALFMLSASFAVGLLILLTIFALQIVVFRYWGAVRLKESIRALRRRREIARAAGTERRRFEALELRFREAGGFAEWWAVVVHAAEELGIQRLDLTMSPRADANRELRWESPSPAREGEPAVRMTLPVPEHGSGQRAAISVTAPIGDESLESVARRMTLLGRLLDEHSLAQLAALPQPDRAATADLKRATP